MTEFFLCVISFDAFYDVSCQHYFVIALSLMALTFNNMCHSNKTSAKIQTIQKQTKTKTPPEERTSTKTPTRTTTPEATMTE